MLVLFGRTGREGAGRGRGCGFGGPWSRGSSASTRSQRKVDRSDELST